VALWFTCPGNLCVVVYLTIICQLHKLIVLNGRVKVSDLIGKGVKDAYVKALSLLEGLGKTTKILRIVGLRAEIRTREC